MAQDKRENVTRRVGTKQDEVYAVIHTDEDGNYHNSSNPAPTVLTDIDHRLFQHAIHGDVDNFGTQVVGFRVNQFEVNFSDDTPENQMQVITKTGSASSSSVEGNGLFESGTDTDMEYILESYLKIDYASAHSLYLWFTNGWITPPTGANDLAMIYFGDANDGYGIGYKGTTWGIQHLRNGVEEAFITSPDMLGGDILAGENDSYARASRVNGEIIHTAEALDPSKIQLIDIMFGWLSIAPTHIRAGAPSGHAALMHTLQHVNLRSDGQTTTSSLPCRIHIKKVGSDSTNIQMKMGCIAAGIVANVQMSQQPDGDYSSAKSDGLARDKDGANVEFRVASLGASSTVQSGIIRTDGWVTIDLAIRSDQVSGSNGVVINYYDEADTETPEIIYTEEFTYSQADADKGSLARDIATRGDGFTLSYTNGGSTATDFYMSATLRTQPRTPTTSLASETVDSDQVVPVKSGHTARDSVGNWGLIGRGGAGEGLDIHITDADPRVLRAIFTRSKVTVATLTATSQQIDATPLTSRSGAILIVDPSNNQDVRFNLGAAATGSSPRLSARDQVVLPFSEAVSIHGVSVSGSQIVYLVEGGEPL